jgi:hypothetical protein
MKRIACILFACVLVARIDAQEYVPTQADIENFLKSTTYVVLEDNPLLSYNIDIRDVMKREWTITPYKFISWIEFEEKRKDKSLSFLVLNQVKFDKDKTDAKYNFISVLMGGDFYSLSQMPDICSVPLSYVGVSEENYIYKLGTLIRFIQNHVKLIHSDPTIISSNIFKHYNENMAEIKGKTLYLVEDELARDVNSVTRIKKVYPNDVKIVSREAIEEAITNGEDIVFLHKVGPERTRIKSRCYKILIGAKDARFYYFDYHRVDEKSPDGFLMSDFKKLAKKK